MGFKVRRPQLKLSQLEEYFSGNGALSELNKKRLKSFGQAVLWYLNRGDVRVWDPGQREVNVWVKRGILAAFQGTKAAASSAGCFEYFDKIPVKSRASAKQVRIVPGAVVRYGSFVAPGAVLMPCFVNVGAYVGEGTMIDTWATVGSCAQVGNNVHVAGGVGIGGVLEPAQAKPVVVGDGAFLGSRVIVVEGVEVGREAVLGAGVVLTASTKIFDVRGAVPSELKGAIPERAVVIPGTVPKTMAGQQFGVPCALVIGTRSPATDLKVSLNQALRDYQVAV